MGERGRQEFTELTPSPSVSLSANLRGCRRELEHPASAGASGIDSFAAGGKPICDGRSTGHPV